MAQVQGPYISTVEAVAGVVVEADEGFTCLKEGDQRAVHQDADGHLYIECAEGRHYLNGQLDSDGLYIGLRKVS